MLLVGFKAIDLGSEGLIMVVYGTLILALMTYLTEPIFGKYIN